MSSKSFIKSSNNQTSIFKMNKEIRMLENSELKNVMLSVVLVQEAQGEEVSRDNLDSRINDALVKNFGMSSEEVVFFKLKDFVLPNSQGEISDEEPAELSLNKAADLVAEKKAGFEAIIKEQVSRVFYNIILPISKNDSFNKDKVAPKMKHLKDVYDACGTQTLAIHYELLDEQFDKEAFLEEIAKLSAEGIKKIHDKNIDTIKKLGLK